MQAGRHALHHRPRGLPQRGRGGPGQARVGAARGREAEGGLCPGRSPRRRRRAMRSPPPRRRTIGSRALLKSGVVPQADRRRQRAEAAAGARRARAGREPGAVRQGGAGGRSRHRHRPAPDGAGGAGDAARGRARPRAHHGPRADGRRRQPDRPAAAGAVRDPGGGGAGAGRHRQQLDRGELQGDRPHAHGRGPAGRGDARHLSRTSALKGEIGSIGAGTGSEFALLPAQNASGNWVKVVQRVPLRVQLDDGPGRCRRCAPA